MSGAVLVGINAYPDSPLSGCVNDAVELGEMLKYHENQNLNFDVKVYSDIATAGGLLSVVSNLFKSDLDTALFYYSGHGALTDRGGYLATPDAKKFEEGVSMDTIMKIVNDSRIRIKIVIIDCCFGGAFGNPEIMGGNFAMLSEGVIIMSACRRIERSVESGKPGSDRHGIFTRLLLNGLAGGASDVAGNITPASLYAYADRSLGFLQQRPVFKANVSRFVCLRKVNPAVPLEVLRMIPSFFGDVDSKYGLDSSYEPTNIDNRDMRHVLPVADPVNTAKFAVLQMMNRNGLVIPNDAVHMFYAAMENKSCSLTALGKHYWVLVKSGLI